MTATKLEEDGGRGLWEVGVRLCRVLQTVGGEAMATRSNALAWKIAWTEEPGGLRSMGSLKVGHD